MNQNKELSQIDVKYRSKISQGHKTIRIDTDDYIALYNMAEYGELIEREQEEERIRKDREDRLYWGVVDE